MARRTQRRRDPRAHELLEELESVYREADRLFARHRCEDATECCRFAVTGREPYVTSIELLAVRRAVAARGGALSEKRRALPLAPKQSREGERTCPMLDDGARCSIYAHRPLGCRTYFCHRATSDRKVHRSEVQALVRRVQDIAARHETDGDRGRPLTRALGER